MTHSFSFSRISSTAIRIPSLFYITKTIINGRSEHPHRWAQTHVCINQRRYIKTEFTNLGIENFIVFFKVSLSNKHSNSCIFVSICKGFIGVIAFFVSKMFSQKIKNHITPLTMKKLGYIVTFPKNI